MSVGAKHGWLESLGAEPGCPLRPAPSPPPDLFFSMAGLTSSVASAVSELSLSDVDLSSSVHSHVASRRASVQASRAGESGHL